MNLSHDAHPEQNSGPPHDLYCSCDACEACWAVLGLTADDWDEIVTTLRRRLAEAESRWREALHQERCS